MTSSVGSEVKTAEGRRQYAKHFSAWRKPLITLAVCLIPVVIGVLACGFFSKARLNEGLRRATWDCVTSHRVDLIAIWLAISGIVYAVFHDHELSKQTGQFTEQLKTLKNQAAELQWLQRSLSTHRIGQFPMYLLEIGKLAKAARKEARKTAKVVAQLAKTDGNVEPSEKWTTHVDVLADCLDYGSFFAPDFHAKVHKAICRAANTSGVRVRMLVCGPMPEPFTGPSGQKLKDCPKPKELLENYRSALLGDPGFIHWIKRLKLRDEVWCQVSKAWFVSLIGETEPMPVWTELLQKDYDEMIAADDEKLLKQLLQIRQLWFAKDLQRVRVEIADLPDRQPIFFWMKYKYGGSEEQKKRDTGDDALFTFANAAKGGGQLGFTTHDHDLLDTFRAMFEEKWGKAKQEEHDWLKRLKAIDTFGETPETTANRSTLIDSSGNQSS